MDDNELAPQDHVGLWELAFRENLAFLRTARGISQSELARKLKARGMKFHQQTVQRVEDGTRPVRLNEAYAIAETLGTDLSTMTTPGTPKALALKYGVDGIRRDLTALDQPIEELFGDAERSLMSLLYDIKVRLDEERPPSSLTLWASSWALYGFDVMTTIEDLAIRLRRMEWDDEVVIDTGLDPELVAYMSKFKTETSDALKVAGLYPFGSLPPKTPPEGHDGEHQETS